MLGQPCPETFPHIHLPIKAMGNSTSTVAHDDRASFAKSTFERLRQRYEGSEDQSFIDSPVKKPAKKSKKLATSKRQQPKPRDQHPAKFVRSPATSSTGQGLRWVVGILAETHGVLDMRVMRKFREENVSYIIHAGDITEPDGADPYELERLDIDTVLGHLREIAPVIAVRGNDDDEFEPGHGLPERETLEVGHHPNPRPCLNSPHLHPTGPNISLM